MINASNEYKIAINDRATRYCCDAEITLIDGTILNLDESKIRNIKIDDAVSQNDKFTVGSAIINKLTMLIDNLEDEYSIYDFTDAIIRPRIGLQLSSTIEMMNKGEFIAEDPKTIGSIISLTAYDNMSKFDKPFKDVNISFPCSADLLLTSVCLHCGVPLASNVFQNSDHIIQTRPIDDAINCREIVSWTAQKAGCFARCNTTGALEIKWYDTNAIKDNVIDGGTFDSATPYASGDNVDGGNFLDYASGDAIDGGTFTKMNRYHHIYSLTSISVATDDVVITGLQVVDTSETPNTVLYGVKGYVISFEGNKLIQSQTDAQTIANTIGPKIVGMKFRPLTINA
jgi:hypothetical protein